jgi:hypothetical protein
MVGRIIYNGRCVSNMHLCVTIAFRDGLRERHDDCHLPQSETTCPSLRIKAPNYIGMNKGPANLYRPSWASAIPPTCGIVAARFLPHGIAPSLVALAKAMPSRNSGISRRSACPRATLLGLAFVQVILNISQGLSGMPRCVCHLRQPLPESITSIRRGAAWIEMYLPRFVGSKGRIR